MFGGRKTMRNRLNSPLPSFFAPAPEALLSAPRPGPHPLEVYDITYLHFHDNLELGVCVSGQGACQVRLNDCSFEAFSRSRSRSSCMVFC